jgi:hypothetical protein
VTKSSLLGSLGVAAEPTRAKSTGPKRAVVAFPGLENYVARNEVKGELEDGLKIDPIKDQILDYFIEQGKLIGRLPQNPTGEEGRAQASMQLRRKDTRSALSPETVARFIDLGITVEHDVVRPETVRVNPTYFQSDKGQEMLEKLLLMARKAGFPDNFFELQTEQARDVVAAETLDDIFAVAKKSVETAKERLASGKVTSNAEIVTDEVLKELILAASAPVVGRSTWSGEFSEAFEIVRQELAPTKAEEKAKVDAELKRMLAESEAATAADAKKKRA